MGNKLSKADYKFNQNAKRTIQYDARQNEKSILWNIPSPIFIPRHKKKK